MTGVCHDGEGNGGQINGAFTVKGINRYTCTEHFLGEENK